MKPDELFNKTSKGQAEMESRRYGLSARQRRVLILVNGQNDVAELERLVQFNDAIDILGMLLADGFIESLSEDSTESPTTVAARDYALN